MARPQLAGDGQCVCSCTLLHSDFSLSYKVNNPWGLHSVKFNQYHFPKFHSQMHSQATSSFPSLTVEIKVQCWSKVVREQSSLIQIIPSMVKQNETKPCFTMFSSEWELGSMVPHLPSPLFSNCCLDGPMKTNNSLSFIG